MPLSRRWTLPIVALPFTVPLGLAPALRPGLHYIQCFVFRPHSPYFSSVVALPSAITYFHLAFPALRPHVQRAIGLMSASISAQHEVQDLFEVLHAFM